MSRSEKAASRRGRARLALGGLAVFALLAAACGGQARPIEALATELSAADVVITSTAKEGFIVTLQGLSELLGTRTTSASLG